MTPIDLARSSAPKTRATVATDPSHAAELSSPNAWATELATTLIDKYSWTVSSRTDLADLDAFCAIARSSGFRKAAALRGVSCSALSHAMRGLEERLGARLFHRTSCSVSLTAAREMLFAELDLSLRGIDAAIDKLDRFRRGPAGRVRVTVLNTGKAFDTHKPEFEAM